MINILRRRACSSADRVAFTYLACGEDEEASLTYAQLDCSARAIGARLQQLEGKGERALLLYPPGLEFLKAFWACLYAGVIAVPAYPPRPNRQDDRIDAIAGDCNPKFLLTTKKILEDRRIPERIQLNRHCLATDTIGEDQHAFVDALVKGDDLAFLQYTSGSTAIPKGVMVRHRNLVHNSAYIAHGFEQDAESISVSWLPHFHDMGLVEGLVQPVFSGYRCYLMSPQHFLQQPFRWLNAISRYKATHSGGPNFAYDLCVRKVTTEQIASIDLSSWAVAYNAAEPVRIDTLNRFAAVFGPAGFSWKAFYPAYGLAEATLKVTGGMKSEGPVILNLDSDAMNTGVEATGGSFNGARSLVGCGKGRVDTIVRIVDPVHLIPCQDGQIGEIWVYSPSNAKGYWNRPRETEQVFAARLKGSESPEFLRTGDLGFFRHGELFVTGRLKDLIIINGSNHHPEDIERTVESSIAARSPSTCAAFSVELASCEQIVLVVEIRDRKLSFSEAGYDSILRDITQAVSERHDLRVHELVFVHPGRIPRTSSGKIQRYLCKAKFLDGTLHAR